MKITLCMVWLLALAFGIGGSLLVMLNFSGNLDRATETAVRSYRMVLSTLRIVDEISPQPDHSNLAQALSQMNTQGTAGWSALRLGGRYGAIYEDNNLAADLSQVPEGQGNEAVATIIRDGHGGRHIRISAYLYAADEALRLDQCYDISALYVQRDGQLRLYKWVFLAVIGIGGTLCWAMAYWLTRPLSALSAASKRFAAGDLGYRAKVSGDDEVGMLTEDFNAMAGKLQQNIEAIRDAAARQETFMGNFAHEMKNPMTAIIGYAELIRSQTLTEAEQMDAANYIFSEGKRLESLSLKLLDILLLKNKEVEFTRCRPAQLVGSMVQHLERVYAEQGIVLQCRCEEGECLLEPDLVRSLLVNLLDNARKAMDKGGNIYIVSQMTEDGCRLRILDTGRGIPEEEIAHITEAFYRVDKARSRAQGGVGLGLALCNEIVRLHNGSLKFESRIGNGTCVTVELRGGRL